MLCDRPPKKHEYVKVLSYLSREYGLKFTVCELTKYLLRKLGFAVYSTIKYPGVDVKIKVSSNPARWKMIEKGWELLPIRCLSNVIKEGQTLFDVGAYIGPYTLLFSKLVRDKGHVYAFEPDIVAFKILCNNIKINHAENVTAENVCLSNSVGKVKLRAPDFGESISSIIRGEQTTNDLREIEVETTTIDDYCEEYNVVPNGIKIDVEGAEALVMEGAQKVVKKYHPWVLLEFHNIFMSEEKRRKAWQTITSSAKKIILINGDNQYHYGSEIASIPDCAVFHIFIEY